MDPDINHRDWTTKEVGNISCFSGIIPFNYTNTWQDELLLHAVLSHGTNWTTISALHTPKRTTLALKNRYSALRLRNENSKKAKDTTSGKKLEISSGTEDRAMTTANKQQGINQRNPDMGHWNSRHGAEAEEEDENEDRWDEEDEDGGDDNCEFRYVSPTPDCKEVNSTVTDTQMKDLSVASPGSAINFSTNNDYGLITPSSSHHDIARLCTEAWMNDTSYLTPCESTYSLDHTSLILGSEFNDNSAIQDRGSINTSKSYSVIFS